MHERLLETTEYPPPDQACQFRLICSECGHCVEKDAEISSRLNGKDAPISFMNNISQEWRRRESAVGPLRPAETDVLRELLTIDHLNFKELLAEGSSLECSLI